jgi:hypothetical protein
VHVTQLGEALAHRPDVEVLHLAAGQLGPGDRRADGRPGRARTLYAEAIVWSRAIRL